MKLMGVLLSIPTIFCAGALLLSATNSAKTSQVKPYLDGPVHEAFITPSTDTGAILRAVPQQPPAPLNEQSPLKCASEAVWVPGYWSWNEELNDYIWISGTWRIAPPNLVWISGQWKQFGSEWAWLRGFWSPVSQESIQYIADRPPSSVDGEIPAAPGDDYFWVPGYWDYNPAAKQYQWLAGKWEKLDPEWIYTPPGYLWRPEGYVFVQPYWDQPFELRGCLYSPVLVETQSLNAIKYTPKLVRNPESILRWSFTHFPDYALFFTHYHRFHLDYWERWCCTPPWWNWNTCWCFNWSDTWALWWWWTHPGYQNPHWITSELSTELAPPSSELIGWMRAVEPPVIITPWGAVEQEALIKAIGGEVPIFPASKEKQQTIFERLRTEIRTGTVLEPTGTKTNISLPRPEVGETKIASKGQVSIPPKPIRIPESPVEPPIYVIPKPQSAYPVLPAPPPGYLPAVPKPFYEQQKNEERPPSYYRSGQGRSA